MGQNIDAMHRGIGYRHRHKNKEMSNRTNVADIYSKRDCVDPAVELDPPNMLHAPFCLLAPLVFYYNVFSIPSSLSYLNH